MGLLAFMGFNMGLHPGTHRNPSGYGLADESPLSEYPPAENNGPIVQQPMLSCQPSGVLDSVDSADLHLDGVRHS